jgi:hypothetical protein
VDVQREDSVDEEIDGGTIDSVHCDTPKRNGQRSTGVSPPVLHLEMCDRMITSASPHAEHALHVVRHLSYAAKPLHTPHKRTPHTLSSHHFSPSQTCHCLK